MIMSDKERVDKHAKVLMLVVGAFIAMLLVIALSGCDKHKGIKTDVPRYNADSIMNDVDMDCGEYHGKEGKSEYGEYEPNE